MFLPNPINYDNIQIFLEKITSYLGTDRGKKSAQVCIQLAHYLHLN